MKEFAYYEFEDRINDVIAKELFLKRINEDDRFESIVDDSILTIENSYLTYYFFDMAVYNHPYLYKNKHSNETVDGVVDINYLQSDREFILNELKRQDATFISKSLEEVEETKEYKRKFSNAIEKFKEQMASYILEKHKIKSTKGIYIDIAPLEELKRFHVDVFYEKVYIFRYRHSQQKKDFVSILSGTNQKFYQLEFVKTEKYLNFLNLFKKPIVRIPSDYIEYYYIDSYKVYQSVEKKLRFETEKTFLKKIKENMKHEEYSQYKMYLKTGIFYFKIKRFLKKIEIVESPLKKKIYLCYLTLKHQMESGLFLWECANLGLFPQKNNREFVYFLESSYSLGSLMAKKKLYEYYNLPQNYNEIMVKKYS